MTKTQDFIVTLEDLSTRSPGNIETLFAQANGFLGVRASLPVEAEESTPGSFVNGFFESHDIIYGENAYGYAKKHETMVKLFDFRRLDMSIDGEDVGELVSEKRQLQLDQGHLLEEFICQTASGKQVRVELESFASHADRTCYAQKWTVTALNFSGQLTLHQEVRHLAAKADEEFDPRIREASADLLFEGNRFSTKIAK